MLGRALHARKNLANSPLLLRMKKRTEPKLSSFFNSSVFLKLASKFEEA